MREEPTILTVDVEPDWGAGPEGGKRGIREGLPRLLDLLDRRKARATFFVVGALAAEVRARLDPGSVHEVGSHGHTHRRLDRVPNPEVEREVSESRRSLIDVGFDPIGFRAPFLARSAGLSGALARAGYLYDASDGALGPRLGAERIAPSRPGDLARVPAGRMRGGFLPANLTWLRLLDPLGASLVPRDVAQFSLHPHELVAPAPGESGLASLPFPLRRLHTRGAGDRALALLDRVLERGGPFVTCRSFLQAAALLAIPSRAATSLR